MREPVGWAGSPGAGPGGRAASGRSLGRKDDAEQQGSVLDGAVLVLGAEYEGDPDALVVLGDGHVEDGGVRPARQVVPPVEGVGEDVVDERVAGARVCVVQRTGCPQSVHLRLAESGQAVGPGVVDNGGREERAVQVEDLQPVGAAGATSTPGLVEGAHRSVPAGTRCTTAAGKVKKSTRE